MFRNCQFGGFEVSRIALVFLFLCMYLKLNICSASKHPCGLQADSNCSISAKFQQDAILNLRRKLGQFFSKYFKTRRLSLAYSCSNAAETRHLSERSTLSTRSENNAVSTKFQQDLFSLVLPESLILNQKSSGGNNLKRIRYTRQEHLKR